MYFLKIGKFNGYGQQNWHLTHIYAGEQNKPTTQNLGAIGPENSSNFTLGDI